MDPPSPPGRRIEGFTDAHCIGMMQRRWREMPRGLAHTGESFADAHIIDKDAAQEENSVLGICHIWRVLPTPMSFARTQPKTRTWPWGLRNFPYLQCFADAHTIDKGCSAGRKFRPGDLPYPESFADAHIVVKVAAQDKDFALRICQTRRVLPRLTLSTRMHPRKRFCHSWNVLPRPISTARMHPRKRISPRRHATSGESKVLPYLESFAEAHVIGEDAALALELALPRHTLEHESDALPLVRAQPSRQHLVHAYRLALRSLCRFPQDERVRVGSVVLACVPLRPPLPLGNS